MTSSYPTPARPIDAIFVKEHARAAARHAEVTVIHLDRVDGAPLIPTPVRASDDEFPTWRVAYRRRPESLSYAANLLAAFRAYARVRRSGFEPDVIHANFFLAGIPAVVLGRVFHKPVVLTEHWTVFLPEDPSTLGRLMTRAARFAFEGAAIVLPVSESLRDAIVATTGARTSFRVVPNAVDERVFYPASREMVPGGDTVKGVGVGDLFDQKGWDILLEALAELRRAGRRDLTVKIVGAGPLEAEVRRRAAELELNGAVELLGYRPKDEVAMIMRGADLLVVPSRFENSPCVIGEALASGVPVVATAVGGIPELVTEADGVLARPGDAESLADALGRAVDGLRLFDRRAISNAAHARFGLDAIGRTLASVYDDTMSQR